MGLKEQFLMEYWGFLWRGVVWNTSTPTHASGRVSGFPYSFGTRLVFIFLLKRRAEALSLAWETNPCKKIHRDIYRPLLSPPLKPSRGPYSPSCQTELLQVFAAFTHFYKQLGGLWKITLCIPALVLPCCHSRHSVRTKNGDHIEQY